jgi:hypothetical protein
VKPRCGDGRRELGRVMAVVVDDQDAASPRTENRRSTPWKLASASPACPNGTPRKSATHSAPSAFSA